MHNGEILDEFEPAALGQGDIGDDQVGLATGNLADGLFRALRTATAHKARLAVQQTAHAVAHHGMIVDEKNALARGFRARCWQGTLFSRAGSARGFRFHAGLRSEQTTFTPFPGAE